MSSFIQSQNWKAKCKCTTCQQLFEVDIYFDSSGHAKLKLPKHQKGDLDCACFGAEVIAIKQS